MIAMILFITFVFYRFRLKEQGAFILYDFPKLLVFDCKSKKKPTNPAVKTGQ